MTTIQALIVDEEEGRIVVSAKCNLCEARRTIDATLGEEWLEESDCKLENIFRE